MINLEDVRSPRLPGDRPRKRSVDHDPADRFRAGRDPLDSRGDEWLRWMLIGCDVIGTFALWVCVFVAAGHGPWVLRVARAVPSAAALAVLVAALNGAQRLYLARVCAIRSVEIGRLARTCVGCGLAALWIGALIHHAVPAVVAVTGAVGTLIVVGALRGMFASWLRSCRMQGRFVRTVCVVGGNEEAAALVELLETQPELGYRVVGVVGDLDHRTAGAARDTDSELPADVVRAVDAAGASGVLVAVSAMSSVQLDRVVRSLIAAGIHVQISSGLARIGHHRLRVAPLSHQLTFYVEPHRLKRWQAVVKRSLDVVLGTVALVCAAPVLAVAAVAIKFGDRGPVIYRQERVGRDGRRFDVLKLRTMVPGASAQLEVLAAFNERKGPLFKVSDDPRVTRVGRFLRATSFDELPQLVNVVRGEMSLVGPRPALPHEVEQFDHELRERVAVPPGLTGLWQVEARDNPSFHAYRRLDLFYVDNWSLAMDLAIIAGTVWVVLSRAVRGLRGGSEMTRQSDTVGAAISRVEPTATASGSYPA